MINTIVYRLAKFLDNMLKSFIQVFVRTKFSKLRRRFPFYKCAIRETIKLIADELFSEKTNKPLMKKEIFIKLLRLATQEQFLYKDCTYYTNKLMVLPWDHNLD